MPTPKVDCRILVAYHTATGSVKAMADAVGEGIREDGARPDLRDIAQVQAHDLLDYHGYILGSPTYYGQPAIHFRRLIDDSVVVHGRLAGRVGAAFSHSANAGGGNETTCLTLCHMLMVHGMLVLGSAQGDHYGPVSVGGPPTERDLAQCRVLGARVAKFARRLAEARLLEGKKAL